MLQINEGQRIMEKIFFSNPLSSFIQQTRDNITRPNKDITYEVTS